MWPSSFLVLYFALAYAGQWGQSQEQLASSQGPSALPATGQALRATDAN
jgi:hypothetical protein